MATRRPAHNNKQQSSPIKTAYLVSYNLASALAWSYVLSLVVRHVSVQPNATYETVKETFNVQNAFETALERASTAFDHFGDTVKWVQTAAILEAVHSATRIVRSPLGTTVAQIASRLLIVWYICIVFPQVPKTPVYVSMVTAWSFAEIIRYLHYVTSLLSIKVSILEWIRYTAFYILYPVGAGSEATLIYFSARYAREKFGPVGYFATIGLTAFWPPALAFMMSHMHAQRRKHVGKRRVVVENTRTTPVKGTRREITSKLVPDAIIENTASATPARSTRSRAKAQ
ncbi:hypothetical protein JCM3766R1_000613 [Sporobolomyces carnicolor]